MVRFVRVLLSVVATLVMAFGGLAEAQGPPRGNAQPFGLSVQALLGRDGLADVYLTTSTNNSAQYPVPNELKEVQLKSFDSNSGRLVYTQNFRNVPAPGGVADIQRTDLRRGQPLQVQALAQTAQTVNTQVLRATGTVKYRPDLTLQNVQAPPQVMAGAHFNVSALVKELNGDVPATGTVRVLNGTTVLDTASPVPVPAGGAIGVAFTLKLDQPGTYTLRMQISNVAPGEWDTTNNSATFTLAVVAPNQNKTLSYYAQYVYYDVYDWNWQHFVGPSTTPADSQSQAGQFDQFYTQYWTSDLITPGGSLRVKIQTEAGTVQDLILSGIQIIDGYYYTYLPDLNGGVEIYQDPSWGTWIYFYRYAGDYVYSYNYTTYWVGSSSERYVYGQFIRATQFVNVSVDLPDNAGSHYGGGYQMALQPYSGSWDQWYDYYNGSDRYHYWGNYHYYYGWSEGVTAW